MDFSLTLPKPHSSHCFHCHARVSKSCCSFSRSIAGGERTKCSRSTYLVRGFPAACAPKGSGLVTAHWSWQWHLWTSTSLEPEALTSCCLLARGQGSSHISSEFCQALHTLVTGTQCTLHTHMWQIPSVHSIFSFWISQIYLAGK